MTESRARTILALAEADPKFRDKLIQLGARRDQFTYLSVESWMQFGPGMLEFAQDAGLLRQVETQESFNELIEWLLENAD